MSTGATTDLAGALRLFGSIFQEEIDAPLLKQLLRRRETLHKALGIDPLEGLDAAMPIDRMVETLAVEYCRLFIGPHGHLPPVESVVLGEGKYLGASSERVCDFYRAQGIELRANSRTFPDHISMELDCLALLEEDGQSDEAAAFARQHLLRWLPKLRDHIDRHATTSFYPAWARGLEALLIDAFAASPPGAPDQ